MASSLRDRLWTPLRAQLTQGVSPARLALALALGGALGVIPILGATTLLCGVAAAGLRLNQPAIQVANYAAAPVQLLLFIPFFRGGARLFGAPPAPFSLDQLRAELSADAAATVARYAAANARAVALWALTAPLAAALLYLLLRTLLSRLPALAAVACLALPAGAARAEDRVQRACDAVEHRVNTLASFTSTTCEASAGRQRGKISLLLLSSATVLQRDDPAKRRLWLVVAVAAVGSALNEDPRLEAEELVLADRQGLMRDHTSWVLPAETARRLQARMAAREIDVDRLHELVEQALVERRIERRPDPRTAK